MPSRTVRTLVGAIAATALSGCALAIAAAPADAAPRVPARYYSCTYPQACLYNQVVDVLLRYKDITTKWQSFTRTDVYWGLNTRNDDVVYIRYTNGQTACLPAGDPMATYYLRDLGTPNGIRIDSSPVCASGTVKLAAKRAR